MNDVAPRIVCAALLISVEVADRQLFERPFVSKKEQVLAQPERLRTFSASIEVGLDVLGLEIWFLSKN
ncbi:hypothetical protein GV827_23030 [Sulfitobacter sp. JBTF-M27]|uniref:Uncharacterized protein n=1 Tax=Sulfitobacter sediminilitoris TaxID=2698830 RepID=A0A6P0CIK6_9RHOB|nr:hypothetical protein [Sulfitobacter sediminilitoris]